uniref:Uncharacterized protein n=1 Tax=Arundo donax TaxID=35708 RepID=A0A0A9FKT1_ARUDO
MIKQNESCILGILNCGGTISTTNLSCSHRIFEEINYSITNIFYSYALKILTTN